MIVYLNGKWLDEKKAAVSITDHGFLYGDGVYETLRVYYGKPFLLGEHLRRLNNSMRGIRLSPPLSLVHLGLAIQKTIEANRHSDAVVRLTITRGPGGHGFDPASCKKPTVLITSRPAEPYPPEVCKRGIIAAVVSIRRNSPQALPPWIKSTSCLNNILAKIESLDASAQEAIMLAHDKSVAEGTVSNVFLVKKNAVITPRASGGLLPGVTRDWVCHLAREAGYRVQEKKVPMGELLKADEVFLTSSLMEVLPVQRLIFNDHGQRRPFRLGPYARTSGTVGPVTLDLMSRFKTSIRRLKP